MRKEQLVFSHTAGCQGAIFASRKKSVKTSKFKRLEIKRYTVTPKWKWERREKEKCNCSAKQTWEHFIVMVKLIGSHVLGTGAVP